jgi:hypothetical protein
MRTRTQTTQDSAGGNPATIAELWLELRRRLEARFRDLNEEIRHYPTPIARCDEQLTKLIEQRDGVRTELGRIEAVGSPDAAFFLSALPSPFAEGPADDDHVAASRSRLKAAILSLQEQEPTPP